MVDELSHEGENIGVVGGGSQNQLGIAEGVLHALGHIRASKIIDHHLGASLGAELICQLHDGFLGVSVDRGIGDDDALLLGLIRGPGVVKIQVVTQIFGQDRAMEGADGLNIQGGGLLQ